VKVKRLVIWNLLPIGITSLICILVLPLKEAAVASMCILFANIMGYIEGITEEE
jgi:hypothetical protein